MAEEEIGVEKGMEEEDQFSRSEMRMIHNPGGGDCLFYAIGSALRLLGWSDDCCSVHTLREVVARSITQDQFETLRLIYSLALENKEDPLLRDYAFMDKGRKSIEALRKVIRTNEYLGDEMALDIIERELCVNLHVIAFTYGVIQEHDKPVKITLRSRMNHTPLKKGSYRKHILLFLDDRTPPGHYMLIKIGETTIFHLDTLPPAIRKKIEKIRGKES